VLHVVCKTEMSQLPHQASLQREYITYEHIYTYMPILLLQCMIWNIFIVKLIHLLLSLFATGYYSGEIKIFNIFYTVKEVRLCFLLNLVLCLYTVSHGDDVKSCRWICMKFLIIGFGLAIRNVLERLALCRGDIFFGKFWLPCICMQYTSGSFSDFKYCVYQISIVPQVHVCI